MERNRLICLLKKVLFKGSLYGELEWTYAAVTSSTRLTSAKLIIDRESTTTGFY